MVGVGFVFAALACIVNITAPKSAVDPRRVRIIVIPPDIGLVKNILVYISFLWKIELHPIKDT
jgi:hypothetical protein